MRDHLLGVPVGGTMLQHFLALSPRMQQDVTKTTQSTNTVENDLKYFFLSYFFLLFFSNGGCLAASLSLSFPLFFTYSLPNPLIPTYYYGQKYQRKADFSNFFLNY